MALTSSGVEFFPFFLDTAKRLHRHEPHVVFLFRFRQKRIDLVAIAGVIGRHHYIVESQSDGLLQYFRDVLVDSEPVNRILPSFLSFSKARRAVRDC